MPYNLDKDNIESDSFGLCELCGFSWCECDFEKENEEIAKE